MPVSSPRRRRGEGDHPEPSAEDGGGVLTAAPICYRASMADAALNLPPALDAFVEDQVRSGAYRDREAVIADAVELLRERAAADEDDEAKLARLNAKLQKAIDSLDRGEGIEITDLTAHFDEIMAEVVRR